MCSDLISLSPLHPSVLLLLFLDQNQLILILEPLHLEISLQVHTGHCPSGLSSDVRYTVKPFLKLLLTAHDSVFNFFIILFSFFFFF